jgi:hypothetical protein
MSLLAVVPTRYGHRADGDKTKSARIVLNYSPRFRNAKEQTEL